MKTAVRIEQVLESAVARAASDAGPPKLMAALRYSVFPGGARVRPHLCLAVAEACGDDDPGLSSAAAAAIEFLHCASLVHDDLPCFDDAETRRGKPSVHRIFGEPLAVLAGDALIVMAFDALARGAVRTPDRLPRLLSALTTGVGAPNGIVAGQAWESEPFTPVEPYHRAKTGALFVAATSAGALAAGSDPNPWKTLGEKLGAAYQAADDLSDVVCPDAECGKPTGQDARFQRPNLVTAVGLKEAYSRLEALIAEAVAAIPPCQGAECLRDLVHLQAGRLAPKHPARSAA